MSDPKLILLALCLILGFLLKRSSRFPKNSHMALNAFVIWISLPSIVLLQMTRLFQTQSFDWELLIPVSMAWIQLLLAFAVIFSLGKIFAWPSKTIGVLVLTAGLGNTSFVGFPLLNSLLGERALPIAILADQLGSFLALSSVGVIFAIVYSQKSRRLDLKTIAQRVIFFPAFSALLTSFALATLNISIPNSIAYSLEVLGATLVPLALFSVGLQLTLSFSHLQRNGLALSCGLIFKLLLAPLFFFYFYQLFPGDPFIKQVSILESAMAPMISAAILADEHGYDSELGALMLGIGIPISLISVPLWNEILW